MAWEEPFGLLVLQFGAALATDLRLQWVDEITASPCELVCAWGPQGTAWDDDVDMAIVAQNLERGEDRFVMTTWHDDHSLEEVVEYFLHTAIAGEQWPSRYAILLLGATAADEDRVRAQVCASWKNRPD